MTDQNLANEKIQEFISRNRDVPTEKACRSELIPDLTSQFVTLSIVCFDGANVFAIFSAVQCLPMISKSALISEN